MHEPLHVLSTDQRDVLSKTAAVFLDQSAAMLIFFRLHFPKDFGGCGVIRFQSLGKVCVDPRIRFFGRNRQRQDFLFGKVFEIFCHGVPSKSVELAAHTNTQFTPAGAGSIGPSSPMGPEFLPPEW